MFGESFEKKVLEYARLIGKCNGNCGSKKATFLSSNPSDHASLLSGFVVAYAEYYLLCINDMFDEVGNKESQLMEDFNEWNSNYLLKAKG